MAGNRVPGPVMPGLQNVDNGTLARSETAAPGPLTAVRATGALDPCANLKADIPMSPLWHMGWAAKGSRGNFDSMQKAIDYLSCRAKKKLSFNEREKEFLKEFFEALWWGGKYKGLSEAAKLANHYVNGEGKRLNIGSEIYDPP